MKQSLTEIGYRDQQEFNAHFAANKKAYGQWKSRQPRKKLKGWQKQG